MSLMPQKRDQVEGFTWWFRRKGVTARRVGQLSELLRLLLTTPVEIQANRLPRDGLSTERPIFPALGPFVDLPWPADKATAAPSTWLVLRTSGRPTRRFGALSPTGFGGIGFNGVVMEFHGCI